MNPSECPKQFNTAQRSAYDEYVKKYSQDLRDHEEVNWVEKGAVVFARFGVEFSPTDYRDNPDKVCAALKVFGLMPSDL